MNHISKNNMANFIKLTDIKFFTTTSVKESVYKYWDVAEKKMVVSREWKPGFKKMWTLITDKGQLDVSAMQMGTMLEACMKQDGTSSIIGRTFSVKTNGKTGMDIRYYFNVVRTEPKIDLPEEDMPF